MTFLSGIWLDFWNPWECYVTCFLIVIVLYIRDVLHEWIGNVMGYKIHVILHVKIFLKIHHSVIGYIYGRNRKFPKIEKSLQESMLDMTEKG